MLSFSVQFHKYLTANLVLPLRFLLQCFCSPSNQILFMTTCFALIIWNKGSVPPIISLKIFFRLNCRQRVATHSTTQPYTFP